MQEHHRAGPIGEQRLHLRHDHREQCVAVPRLMHSTTQDHEPAAGVRDVAVARDLVRLVPQAHLGVGELLQPELLPAFDLHGSRRLALPGRLREQFVVHEPVLPGEPRPVRRRAQDLDPLVREPGDLLGEQLPRSPAGAHGQLEEVVVDPHLVAEVAQLPHRLEERLGVHDPAVDDGAVVVRQRPVVPRRQEEVRRAQPEISLHPSQRERAAEVPVDVVAEQKCLTLRGAGREVLAVRPGDEAFVDERPEQLAQGRDAGSAVPRGRLPKVERRHD